MVTPADTPVVVGLTVIGAVAIACVVASVITGTVDGIEVALAAVSGIGGFLARGWMSNTPPGAPDQ